MTSGGGGFKKVVRRALTENLLSKLISLAVAILLWFVVLWSRNVEATKEVPLELITPPELMASNEVPDRVTFRLAGPKAFLRTILDRRDDPIRVNLSSNKAGLVTYRFFSDNIRLPIGVKVLSVSPTAILIKLEPIRTKEVPVRVQLRGNPPEGFRITGVRVQPETLRVRGAESRVDGLSEILASTVDISELRQSTEKEAVLDLQRYGVQIEGPIPRVTVGLEPISANFRIKNVEVHVVSPLSVKIEEKTVQLWVRVQPKDLKLLDRSRVVATVDLTTRPKGNYQETVKVTLPPGVGLVKVIPEQVHVTLY